MMTQLWLLRWYQRVSPNNVNKLTKRYVLEACEGTMVHFTKSASPTVSGVKGERKEGVGTYEATISNCLGFSTNGS